jgi:hypothetical protein
MSQPTRHHGAPTPTPADTTAPQTGRVPGAMTAAEARTAGPTTRATGIQIATSAPHIEIPRRTPPVATDGTAGMTCGRTHTQATVRAHVQSQSTGSSGEGSGDSMPEVAKRGGKLAARARSTPATWCVATKCTCQLTASEDDEEELEELHGAQRYMLNRIEEFRTDLVQQNSRVESSLRQMECLMATLTRTQQQNPSPAAAPAAAHAAIAIAPPPHPMVVRAAG